MSTSPRPPLLPTLSKRHSEASSESSDTGPGDKEDLEQDLMERQLDTKDTSTEAQKTRAGQGGNFNDPLQSLTLQAHVKDFPWRYKAPAAVMVLFFTRA